MEGRTAPALVGRQQELERVAGALGDADCHGVVLQGEAGVGKTRLAQECLGIGADLGYTTGRVMASPATTSVPLGALAPLLPPLGDDANPLGAARAALLERRGGEGRLMLLVDDAQWLDDISAALVLQVVLEGDAFLLLTTRSGAEPPDAVRSLLRQPAIRRVPVQPLDAADVARLAGSVLDGPVDPSVVARVVELAQGSPLTARELVLGGVESGALVRRDGRWVQVAPLEHSDRVAELVSARLGRLDDRSRSVLTAVALAEPLPLAWAPSHTAGTLASLEARGLVAVDGDTATPEVRVAHPLYGESLRDGLPPLQRRVLLGELVDSVAERGDLDDHAVLRVALWSLDLGRAVAADRLRRAARRAFVTHRFDLATRLLDAVPEGDRDAGHRFELVNVLAWGDDFEQVDRMLEEMEARPEDDAELARAARLSALHAQNSGEFDRADAVLSRAAARLGDPALRDQLETVRAFNAVGLMSPPEAVDALLPLLDVVPEASRVPVGQTAAFEAVLAGRPETAAAVIGPAHRLHRRLWVEDTVAVFPSHPSSSLLIECVALAAAGRIDRAAVLARESEPFEGDAAPAVVVGHVELTRGYVAWRRGDLAAAARSCRRAGERYRGSKHELGPRWLFAWSYAALALAQRGDAQEAAAALEEARRSRTTAVLAPVVATAEAWVEVSRHRVDAAVERLVGAVQAGREGGGLLFALEAAWGLVRLGGAEAVPLDPGACREVVEGELLGAWLDAIDAARDGDAAALDAAADRLERCGAWLDAAEAAAAASRCWTSAGRPREATASAGRVRDLVGRCGGAATPGLVLAAEPVALTAREREVAALAAAGTPSREIAERLSIADRTVTNHLQRVYDKLGVSSRAELREVLGPPGTSRS